MSTITRWARKLTKKQRAALYSLGIATGGVLVYFGQMEPEALMALTPLLLALLNLTPDDVQELPGQADPAGPA